MENGDQFAMLIECSEQGATQRDDATFCFGKAPSDLQKVFDDVLEARG